MDKSIEADVDRARAMAIRLHDGCGHTRSTGEPYWHHPERVVATLHKFGAPPSIRAAAWLHDVPEDCPADLAGCDLFIHPISAEFGPEVGSIVREVTNFFGPEATMEVKQAHLCEHARTMSDSAKWIKLADRFDNISGMQGWADSKKARYGAATMNLMTALKPWPQGSSPLAEAILERARDMQTG